LTVSPSLRAFAGYGIELEYTVVDATSLDARPLAPMLLGALDSGRPKQVDGVAIDFSHELVAHVVEMKNVAPTPSLTPLVDAFRAGIDAASRHAAEMHARLMPTGMHPWMDPRDAHLWTASDAEIYRAFDRVFDCRRHGWANVQSMHINLPFADDPEFARLHAAVRVVLPLIPALAASSPIADSERTPFLDYRLEVYRTNSERVPTITGAVIPDNTTGRANYERAVLEPMYEDIAPHDTTRALRHEWLNARGAIARFDRNAIEIRLCDTQECPRADLAIAALVVAVVRALYEEQLAPLSAQQALATPRLAAILRNASRNADEAIIADASYLRVLGLNEAPLRAGEVWVRLAERCGDAAAALDAACHAPLEMICASGPLARRIVRAVDGAPSRATLEPVYRRLCDCLAHDTLFVEP
jgi:gamma-glutamyl:cysteine ligase YbdK (ATP-grasp superfamily)